ncbi:MAG: exodeoxyribonuclease VII large subunit, partial [Peptococcaceae bacterium]|nr:exodeoxyribonuclease VII large subunit [Peptococcaceae bacterium]
MAIPRIFSVYELTTYLKGILERDKSLQNIWLKGEISNFKLHTPSGHMYFTLKDENSSIKAVMFRSKAIQVQFRPEHGMKVIVRGYLSLYERDGQY